MLRRLTRSLRALLAMLAMAAALVIPTRAQAVISAFQATPAYFSPNGDGVLDQVNFTWGLTDAASDVQLVVTPAAGGAPVRTIDLGARPAGLDSAPWDGKDGASVVVAEGSYKVTLVETPAAGGTTPNAVAVVVVDITPPDLPTIDGATDSSQVAVIRFVEGTAPGADSVRVYLNGLFAASGIATLVGDVPEYQVQVDLLPGANQIAVQGKDLAGNLSALTPPITARYLNAPDLFARGTSLAFSPNGDGVKDTIFVRTFVDAPTTRLVVDVRSGSVPASGETDKTQPVAHLYDGPANPDTLLFAWDGRDSAGAAMPDGPYMFRVKAWTFNALGDSFFTPPISPPFTLDTRPPGTPVPSPLPTATTFRNFLVLAGPSAGADSIFVLPDGPRTIARPFDGGFQFELPLNVGPNTFSLQAVDSAGNLSAVAGPYTVDFELPTGFHANERFRANDAFVFNLQKAATAIDITLYTLRGRRVRTLSSHDVQLHYEIPWDGLDDLGDVAGDGPYVARATVTYVDGTRTESKGAVVLVK